MKQSALPRLAALIWGSSFPWIKLADWAQGSLNRFGARIIIGCRFIPGGRTAITLTCGLVGYPRRRFVTATAFAAVIWASYAFLIGRLGGRAFEGRPWAGLLLALALTVLVSVVIEAARRVWAWRLGSSAASAGQRTAAVSRRPARARRPPAAAKQPLVAVPLRWAGDGEPRTAGRPHEPHEPQSLFALAFTSFVNVSGGRSVSIYARGKTPTRRATGKGQASGAFGLESDNWGSR